jgi:protein tyrosine/serine phosphatase
MSPKFLSRCLLFITLATLVGPAAYGLYRWERGNFDVVSQNIVYRSRQLNAEELIDVVQRHRLKSILNLRGQNQVEQWYRDEAAVADRMGLHLFNYPISARHELDRTQLAEILEILQQAPKPILIHCRSGADRTSLVSALYLEEVEQADPAVASQQLSLYYGHLPPFLGAESSAMDRTFWRVARTDRPLVFG